MHIPRRFLALLPLACALASAPVAHAQQPGAQTRAQALFEQGLREADANHCEAAIPLYKKSLQTFRSNGARYQLALCEERLGKIASASKDFGMLLLDLPASDTRKAKAAARIAALKSRIPQLKVVLPAGLAAGSKIVLDGEVLEPDKIGIDLPVDPGQHLITAVVNGVSGTPVEITLAEKERQTVITAPMPERRTAPPSGATDPPKPPPVSNPVVPLPQPAPPQPQPPSEEASAAPPDEQPEPGPPMSGTRIAGFAIGSLGLASLVASAVTGGMAIARKNEIDGACPGGPTTCRRNVGDVAASGSAFSTASTATFVAGLACAGLGVTLILVGGPEAKPATLAVTALPGGAGLLAAGHF